MTPTNRVILAFVATAILIALVSSAFAHSWYPWECCSDNDCAPIPLRETPVEKDGGFYLIDGRFMPYKSIKMSPDGQWHLCEEKWPENTANRKILCLYAPIGGS